MNRGNCSVCGQVISLMNGVLLLHFTGCKHQGVPCSSVCSGSNQPPAQSVGMEAVSLHPFLDKPMETFYKQIERGVATLKM